MRAQRGSNKSSGKNYKQTSLTDCFKHENRNVTTSSGAIGKRVGSRNSNNDGKVNSDVRSVKSKYFEDVNSSPTHLRSPQSADTDMDNVSELNGSQPLFSDDDDDCDDAGTSVKSINEVSKQSKNNEAMLSGNDGFLGPELSHFRRPRVQQLPPLKPTSSHVVLFNTRTFDTDPIPKPWPTKYQDAWDQVHVRLPCSSQNLYPVGTRSNGEPDIQSRWEMIQKALLDHIDNAYDLQEAILSYNQRYKDKWKFEGLQKLLNGVMVAEETDEFFKTTLPAMARLAVQLPEICTQPIPLLKQGENRTLTLSQQQIACLLANAFFCTFPRRNAAPSRKQRRQTREGGSAEQAVDEYANYPEINFFRLFASKDASTLEKLRCLLHYFHRVTKNMSTGVVSFTRQSMTQFPDWSRSRAKLSQLHVSQKGTIEDFGEGMLQVDFANQYVGGGVLGLGCVQEEIRFVICPEMIASMLVTERMLSNECLIMHGCERYSYYMGYADTFEWSGAFYDEYPRDAWRRIQTEVVAMDALHFWQPKKQYQPDLIERELNKAYCGFVRPGVDSTALAGVATGNWGCGAFGGDTHLKSIIQLLAASEAGRDMAYFTFGNEVLMNDLFAVYQGFIQRQMCVGDVYSLLVQFFESFAYKPGKLDIPLFDYILATLTYEDDTDSESGMPSGSN